MTARAETRNNETPEDGLTAAAASGPGERAMLPAVDRALRSIPIRWRILSVSALNGTVVVVLAILLWSSSFLLNDTWRNLVQVRQSERLLTIIEAEAGRIQSLIHRYFTQPSPEVLAEVETRWGSLTGDLLTRAAADSTLAPAAQPLREITNRLVSGFDQLREARAQITSLYEDEVLKSSREMGGLYAILESTVKDRTELLAPSLAKSREAFAAAVVAMNSYYLSVSPTAAQEAQGYLTTIINTLPVMHDMARGDIQGVGLDRLLSRAIQLREGLNRLSAAFDEQYRVLREIVDKSQAELTDTAQALSATMQTREANAQARLDSALRAVFGLIAAGTLASILFVGFFGTLIARSISRPLRHLMHAMNAIIAGSLTQRVRGLDARDEIGAMARDIEVFRQNAIAKLHAEEELRASKTRAEAAYAELRDTQNSLIESEKLAALGGLVAGVAHEVNNPVGISLTVASSLERRCELFAAEISNGDVRRSRLNEFVAGNRDASAQLVTNLHRAAELIQSFKQVAVDRSHAERRSFDLSDLTEQIAVSLRPGLSKRDVSLDVNIPAAITLDSYPGPYGQVVTNLFLNAVNHAFEPGILGKIAIDAHLIDREHVEITFTDNGRGMSADVRRRAYDPFFTTARAEGGTGLGLHIVYTIVTTRLGGRMIMESEPGRGTIFRIVIPLTAPSEMSEATVNEPAWSQLQ